jgi:hypothetical protein
LLSERGHLSQLVSRPFGFLKKDSLGL